MQEQLPRIPFMGFQQPGTASAPPIGDGWIHEIKYDGYRTQLIVDAHGARAFTKSGHDWSDRYWPITLAARGLPCKTAVMDGEIIACGNDGLPDFNLLQSSISRSPQRLVFVAFDLLHVDGRDMRVAPLIKRKERLRSLIPERHDFLQYSDHVEEDGQLFFSACDRMGLEGMVSKRKDSRYRVGPSKSWLKTKCYATGSYEVIGVDTNTDGIPIALLASLETGSYVGSAFVSLGGEARDTFWKRVDQLKTATGRIGGLRKKKARWLKPGLVVNVKHLKGEELLRHASLTGIALN